MNFDELNLAPAILEAVREQGYTTPTPIQAQAIPAVLAGHDLLAGAQTGTGKTAAFTLPMLQRLSTTERLKSGRGGVAVRALVLTPTRELAAQVEESVQTYGKNLSLTSAVIFGGVGMNPQINMLKKAWTSWWPRRAVCSICSSRASWTSRRCRSWCSMKPTACSTWASSTT
jgi:ATP-dependent RNA helicase RhlE